MKCYLYVFFIICPSLVIAYETGTHSIISNFAVQASVLVEDIELLSDLGFDVTARDAFLPSLVPANPDGTDPDTFAWVGNTSIIRIITGGAVMEDAGKRSRHHFYDPQNGGSSGIAGHRSPDWILESIVQPVTGRSVPVTLPGQEYSYRDALEYYYQSQVLTDENDRRLLAGLMFRSLGHVIHHIQDMTQPQHVRNDGHCDATSNFPGVALICFFLGQHNPSFYERYTGQRIQSIDLSEVEAIPEGINTARDFWDNSSGSGAAQLTSLNFVSDGTNFINQAGRDLIQHPAYPAPMPLQELVPVELSRLLLNDPLISSLDRHAILQRTGCSVDPGGECLVNFIQSRGVSAGVEGQTVNNERASTVSIFDEELRTRNIEISNPFLPGFTISRLVMLNRYNFESAYPLLLPLAVSYSSGLIDHFFRGRLKFTESRVLDNQTTLLTFQNVSTAGNDLQPGHFELYYDSQGGARMSLQFNHHSGDFPVKAGDMITLEVEIPEDVDKDLLKPYVLIFDAREGQIGTDPGIAATRFMVEEPGRVSALLNGVFVCPEKIFGIRVSFPEQPENNGQVVLRGAESSTRFDFRDVRPGHAEVKDEARWKHGFDIATGEYQYEVTYNFPEAEINTCIAPSLGPWLEGERVTVE